MYQYKIYFKGRNEPVIFEGDLVHSGDGIARLKSKYGDELLYRDKNVLFLCKKEVVND